MIKIDISYTDNISKEIKDLNKKLNSLAQEYLVEYKSLTPIRTGNARRSTHLQGKDTIVANYPYAERLDEGWSRQAPRGMTIPFEKWLEKKFRKIFRN